LAALILWPAGTLAYPAAWAFIGLVAIGGSKLPVDHCHRMGARRLIHRSAVWDL